MSWREQENKELSFLSNKAQLKYSALKSMGLLRFLESYNNDCYINIKNKQFETFFN